MTRNGPTTPRARGSLGRWSRRIGLTLAGLVAIAVSTGAGYEIMMRSRSARLHPAPGRLVDIGGRRLQLDCRGAGSPTVVLESGLDHLGALSWAAVHDSIARTTRACAYSRAGILWSDPAPGPFDARRAARDLHTALVAAGERAPWVLVGHSLGGPYTTLFTSAYPSEVAGLVFVDASHPAQFARFREATGKSMKPPAGLLAAGSALAWTGLVRFAGAGGAPASWPAAAATVPAAYLPTSIRALRTETEAADATLAAAASAQALGDRPLVVLTAAAELSPEALAREGVTRAEGTRMQAAWRTLQGDEATWSSRGRHELVRDASHYIQFDRPDLVIGAVREVVARVRAPQTAFATP
jgi:pimeloyl-ACP methyl ester carboxylesterase